MPKNINQDDEKVLEQLEEGNETYDERGKRVQVATDQKLFAIKILHSGERGYLIESEKSTLTKCTPIIADAKFGKDLCRVLGEVHSLKSVLEREVFKLIRVATQQDIDKYENNKVEEKKALSIIKEKVAIHKLDMKIISAHYLTDEPKLMFYFTSDNRVDFRNLVRDLVSIFKARIELRQIGVRDEAKLVGGCSVCGRSFCCKSVSEKFCNVSIKMAKEQDLSLNSMKISGPCGRLLCCLSFENEFYKDEKKSYPKLDSIVKIEDQKFKIIETNILKGTVKAINEENGVITIPFNTMHYNEFKKRWKSTIKLSE